MSGGNDFGSFCANKNVVIEPNVSFTFSRVGGTSASLARLRASTYNMQNVHVHCTHGQTVQLLEYAKKCQNTRQIYNYMRDSYRLKVR